ncbi:monovalent cation/H(+) antiporter subunit G [Lipingzhangella sp. LS1_29]|uniref:Monovalent cation/H(+) antiporter subunit G n=1 Tax=Lipingzhangella rawalii TaxID=2055835 RepID=A0ABU2H3M7_9ACTN|nr:monovalent cation/H(+) antiporter subunit G [Lipingzhangella rawalii]
MSQVPWLELAAGVAIGVGTLLMLTAGVALLRLQDVYSRMNAVTKAATLGVVLILIGSFLLMPSWETSWKLVLAVWLQLITSPVGAFAIGRAAYRSRAPLTEQTRVDELEQRVARTDTP